jgi:hypothetical protein
MEATFAPPPHEEIFFQNEKKKIHADVTAYSEFFLIIEV